MDVAARMDKPLAAALSQPHTLRTLDFLVFLNYPFVYLASLMPGIMSLVLYTCRGQLALYIMMALVELAVLYLGCVIFGGVLAWLAGLRDGRIVPTLLGFPIFMASWLPLQIISLVKRVRRWQPIQHGAVLK